MENSQIVKSKLKVVWLFSWVRQCMYSSKNREQMNSTGKIQKIQKCQSIILVLNMAKIKIKSSQKGLGQCITARVLQIKEVEKLHNKTVSHLLGGSIMLVVIKVLVWALVWFFHFFAIFNNPFSTTTSVWSHVHNPAIITIRETDLNQIAGIFDKKIAPDS